MDVELTRLFARAYLATPHGQRSAACRKLAEQALRGLAIVRSDAEAAQAARELVALFETRGPELTGHPDGFCLRYEGEVAGVFATLDEAAEALAAARASGDVPPAP